MEIFVVNVTHSDSDQTSGKYLAGLCVGCFDRDARFSQIYWSVLINFSLLWLGGICADVLCLDLPIRPGPGYNR